MTSEALAECFVYITLPGETGQVTAGRYTLGSDRRGAPEGRFVYGRSYLERPNAVSLDPFELKLAPRVYATNALGGIFGALRDASPDFWGRRVIQRHLGRAQPSELDYLRNSPDDRAGALGFGLNQVPPAPRRMFNRTLDLANLQVAADAIGLDEEQPADTAGEQLDELLLIGTSMGGARPKAVVEDDAGLWVAKFNRPDDGWNSARVEHAMLLLARACGLDAAASRVEKIGGRDVLLVKRFDREKTAGGYLRARMVSALTLLRAEDTYQSRDKWSYVLLVEEVRRACAQPANDAAELFRRMCFNALISNIDDHPRNHALIAKGTDWRLSPAYDLTPSVPLSMERRDLAMECGDTGRFANADNLLSQSARFLMEPDQAVGIIDAMEERVRACWYAVAREAGVTARDGNPPRTGRSRCRPLRRRSASQPGHPTSGAPVGASLPAVAGVKSQAMAAWDVPKRISNPRRHRLDLADCERVFDHPTLADAILDRFVHCAYKSNLTGDSMRKHSTGSTDDPTLA